MFKEKDIVHDVKYGDGVIVKIDTKYEWGLNSKYIGCVYVKFFDQDDGEPPIEFTLDGRQHPEDSGYYWRNEFFNYPSIITLKKV
jgi:hypothetical protein